MKIVVVRGKTKTGIIRVERHGHTWKILKIKNDNILIESMLDKYVCWIKNPATGVVEMEIENVF